MPAPDDVPRPATETSGDAAREADVVGLHDKLLDYLGKLKFRTSYSQNVLRHSIEVAFLTGMMAEEIGLDGALGRPRRAPLGRVTRRPAGRRGTGLVGQGIARGHGPSLRQGAPGAQP